MPEVEETERQSSTSIVLCFVKEEDVGFAFMNFI